MRLKECYEKGLLRKRRPDRMKSERAMELAMNNLERAGKLLENEFFMESRLLSYTGMFQAARALLFNEGVFERSHACVVEYLKAHYVRKHVLEPSYINWLDTMRVVRHQSLYGLDIMDISLDDAEDSLDKATGFVKEIRRLLDIP